MGEEDNSEYDEAEFVSDIENEFGNIEEEPVVGFYTPTSPETIDYYITHQND